MTGCVKLFKYMGTLVVRIVIYLTKIILSFKETQRRFSSGGVEQ